MFVKLTVNLYKKLTTNHTMQKFLNDQYKEDINCLSNPACCIIVLLLFLVACIFPIIGIYCFESWTCPSYMGYVFLEIGIIFDVFIVIFIIIPCFIRLILNYCYEPDIPAPPKSKPPKSAFRSFSESAAKGRSKSFEYTENPLKEKRKSKSDSEV